MTLKEFKDYYIREGMGLESWDEYMDLVGSHGLSRSETCDDEITIAFAQYHVKKALEAAKDDFPCGGSDPIYCEDIESIIKECYPEKNIR
jgi:hypothetical protein